jgi:hypothetical protein
MAGSAQFHAPPNLPSGKRAQKAHYTEESVGPTAGVYMVVKQ